MELLPESNRSGDGVNADRAMAGECRPVLAAIWEAAEYPWSLRLKALLAELNAPDSQALPDDGRGGEAASEYPCSTN